MFEFTEHADQLVDKVMINQHTRVFLFLQAFSDKVGDKLCKRYKIDIEDPTTTVEVWEELKKEALKVSTKVDSQMSRLWKSKKVEESRHVRPAKRKKVQEKTVILERLPKS